MKRKKRSLEIHPYLVKCEREIGPQALSALISDPLARLTPRQDFFMWLFRQWLEINSTLSRLELAGRFLDRIRPGGADSDEIAYHVEKHLEEIYILKERMRVFLTQIERRLKRKRLFAEARDVARLRVSFEKGVDGVVKTRGEHVHGERFLDRDIGQLSVLDGMLDLRENPDLRRLRGPQAQAVLRKWRRIVSVRHKGLSRAVADVLQQLDRVALEVLPPPPPTAGAP